MLSLYSTLDNYVLSHNGAAIAVFVVDNGEKMQLVCTYRCHYE